MSLCVTVFRRHERITQLDSRRMSGSNGQMQTLPETNIAPQKGLFQEEHLSTINFQGLC